MVMIFLNRITIPVHQWSSSSCVSCLLIFLGLSSEIFCSYLLLVSVWMARKRCKDLGEFTDNDIDGEDNHN